MSTEDAAAPQMPPVEEPTPIEDVVTNDVVESIVKAINPDLEVVDFIAVPGTQAGDNFMSIMYKVTINLKSRKTGNVEELHIMLKTMPKNAMRVQMINDCQAFVKESQMYSEIFPNFLKFQKGQGIKESEIFQPYPLCYKVFHDGKNDFIAMEDLKHQNFGMGCRIGGLNLEEATIVMKSLAKFHAISYAMYKGDYNKILADYPFLSEKMFQEPEKVQDVQKMWLKSTIDREASMIRDNFPGHEHEALSVEKMNSEDFWGKMFSLVGTPVANAVIGHGDCWTNNFMFKYDKTSKKPVDMKFVDFQISRVSSRTIDLGYFLYTSPQTELLNDKEAELLKIYYDEFKDFATKLGYYDSELTFEQLVEEFNNFRRYGIAMGLLLAPILSAAAGAIPDMETMPDDIEQMKGEESFDDWFEHTKSNNLLHNRVFNFAKYHLPKLNQ